MKKQSEIDALNEAIAECDRFRARAKKAIADLKRADSAYYGNSIMFASAKRASMDLTRVLVRVRNPNKRED